MKIYENLKEKAFKAVSGVKYFSSTALQHQSTVTAATTQGPSTMSTDP